MSPIEYKRHLLTQASGAGVSLAVYCAWINSRGVPKVVDSNMRLTKRKRYDIVLVLDDIATCVKQVSY